MKLIHCCAAFVAILAGLFALGAHAEQRPIIVAHRGASGYLPEHTLAAKALAYGMGADFIEQDVVLTSDDVPVVLHDIHIDTVTNVADVFPGRARSDGRFYAVDFALAEIKTLRVSERIDLKTKAAVFPRRFPRGRSSFRVPTLAEEIELIQGLNKSTGRDVGIYPEIKSPAWHRKQDKDISRVVLRTLERYGYSDRDDRAYVQCFDASETKRMRHELDSKLKLVQLIGENDWNEAPTDFKKLRTADGIRRIAEYANGVGPWINHIVEGRNGEGQLALTALVKLAHQHGLEVHPFTFRADALPDYADSFDDLLQIFLVKVRVDGLFTDFPDLAVRVRNRFSRPISSTVRSR